VVRPDEGRAVVLRRRSASRSALPLNTGSCGSLLLRRPCRESPHGRERGEEE
jgi:hypothetical protein